MVEENGAYKHGKYERIWQKSSRLKSDVKLLATQDGRIMAVHLTNTTDYRDPCATHMDENNRRQKEK